MHPASPLVGSAPPIGPTHDRWSARRLDRSLQRRVDFLHPAELDQASGDCDVPSSQTGLQRHELKMLVQRFLMLTQPFAGLAKTLPRLGRRRDEPPSGCRTPARPRSAGFHSFDDISS